MRLQPLREYSREQQNFSTLSQNLFKNSSPRAFLLFFVLGRHPEFSVVILNGVKDPCISSLFLLLPVLAIRLLGAKSASSLQFLNSFSEVIFLIEFVILGGVWRGFYRQTQPEEPEEAHPAPTLRPFLTTNIASNF